MLEYPKEGSINKEKVEFSRTLGNYSGQRFGLIFEPGK